MDAVKCRWFALAAAAALSALPARGGDAPTRTYRNGQHKFSLKVFPDWTEVPVEISDRFTVAKFYEPGDRGDWFQPELEICRLDKRGATTGPVTGIDPKKQTELEEALKAATAPKSVFDLTFGRLIVPGDQKSCDPKAFKKVTSSDKVDGKLWLHEIPRGANTKDKMTTLFAGLAAFEKDGVEYGILLTGPARRREDFEPALKTIAKSFQFFDEKAKENVALELLEGVNITPKRRLEIEKGLIKGWGLEVSPKKNYVVLYNTKKNRNRPLARTIAERIEKIREQIYEVQFPPAQAVKAVSIVRVCGDREEYHAYGGPGGSAGYWNDDAEELVFYDASPARSVDDNTLAVLYHEAFHQYIYYSVGNVAPHSWFNEGHGDYYAGARYVNGKFKLAPFDWRVGTVKTAIREGPRPFVVQKDEKTGKERRIYGAGIDRGYTPLRDLVAFSQGEYYSYPGVSYAQGWSLVYFLREAVPKKKEWNAKWGRILEKYFAALKREVAKEGKLVRGGERPDEPGPTGPDEPKEPEDPKEPKEGPDEPKEPKEPGGEAGGGEGGGGEGGDEPPPDPGFQPLQGGEASESALETALREAFEGVDFAELEDAWKEFTKNKVSGG
jgi:hypothetical protein